MLPDRQRHPTPEGATIVMQTRTFDFEVLAVEPEAGGGIEMKFANSKANGFVIQNPGAIAHRGRRCIQGRAIKIPAKRILNRDFILKSYCLAGIDRVDVS